MKKLGLVAFAGILLAGCSTSDFKGGDTQLLTYQCGAVPLMVTQSTQQDAVTIILDGKLRTLSQSISASGAKYDDGEYTFWSKGNSATVFKNDEIMLSDCTLVK